MSSEAREARESQAVVQAAEQAAAAGDHAKAETLLREAARVQEASLGPRHPDLANTLNNLGIVCEMTGKPDEAEQYFRRAVSIARTSLHPDHPFVATSQRNLREFCESRGRQVELPVAPPAPAAPRVPVPVPEVIAAPAPEPGPELGSEPGPEPRSEPEPEPELVKIDAEAEDDQLPPNKLFQRVALGALGPIAMLMVVAAVGLPRLGAPELNVPSRAVAAEAPRNTASAATAPPAVVPADVTVPDEPAVETTPAPAPPPEEPATPKETAAPKGAVSVMRASLCGELDDWSCDPADRPVPTGPLFFYTQIKSTSATNVEHRWYHDNRLHQSVKLRIQANRTAGYRTYSRNIMTSDSAGDWRIELRSEDGSVLHQERFTVH
jgi:hypothetical protein